MNPDEQFEKYMQVFRSGQEHTHPSPETIENINNIKISLACVEQKLDTILDAVNSKADKWVEKAMIWLITAVAGLNITIIGGVILWWITHK